MGVVKPDFREENNAKTEKKTPNFPGLRGIIFPICHLKHTDILHFA